VSLRECTGGYIMVCLNIYSFRVVHEVIIIGTHNQSINTSNATYNSWGTQEYNWGIFDADDHTATKTGRGEAAHA
jgi:hypothetical protein